MLGYDIVRVSPKGNNVSVEAVVPSQEWSDLHREYFSKEGLAVSNVRAFGQSWSWLGKIIRDAKKTGRPWVNPEMRQLLDYEKGGGNDGDE
jgi:hypothetical protein